jgi:hypothetical protein
MKTASPGDSGEAVFYFTAHAETRRCAEDAEKTKGREQTIIPDAIKKLE